jgi:D-arabinose 1-dehydrogenase-like Zn-dependent alcohol dehydrogenase
MEAALQFLARGIVKPVISDVFSLEDANEAIERVRRGASGRVVLKVG